jgi:hypothetical protein
MGSKIAVMSLVRRDGDRAQRGILAAGPRVEDVGDVPEAMGMPHTQKHERRTGE